MRVVINKCFGGFGLSDAAYEKFIEWGVPVQKYIEQQQHPVTRLYESEPRNAGEVLFDRELTVEGEDKFNDLYHKYKHTERPLQGRYWETWTREQRSHPLVLRVVEELGKAANGQYAKLAIVDVPDDVEFSIKEYDGNEHIAEAHRTWE